MICPQAKSSETMRYRIVPVGNSQWMSAKPADKQQVREQVDRIAADGYNVISIGTYTFMPMHLVDYADSPWPEAVQYAPEKVKANLTALRENIRYAKSKGIEYVVSRSYSHYAPYNFWRARQAELNPNGVFDSLLRKAHQNDMFLKALNGQSPNCVPQQQWTNPVFRDFFLWSTSRVLDLVPELDGFLNAYAEAAWTYDTGKVSRNDWRSWKECVDYPATDSCFIDYCNTLSALLRSKRGDDYFFGMRDWYVAPQVLAKLEIPRDKLVIAVKYAGYDQPLVNTPPWAKDLLDDGFSVVLDMHVYDAEYPHPVYWYSGAIVNKIFENIYRGGFSGIVYQDYTLRGEDSHDNPIRRLTQLTVAAAMNRRPFARNDADAFLRKYYGDGTDALLSSLESVAAAQENFIKLMPAWFWRGDGLSVGGLQPPRLWMMHDNPEAGGRMKFVRQDAVGVPAYIAEFLKGEPALAEAQRKWKAEGLSTPPEILSRMDEYAENAVSLILAARDAAPANAPYMQDLVASAMIHRCLTERSAAYLNAAMAFYKSGYIFDDKWVNDRTTRHDTGMDQREACMSQLQKFISADLLMRRLMLDYAPRRRTMRHANTYESEKKMASIMKMKLVVPQPDPSRFEAMSAVIENKKTND